jgi:hypothetical protein
MTPALLNARTPGNAGEMVAVFPLLEPPERVTGVKGMIPCMSVSVFDATATAAVTGGLTPTSVVELALAPSASVIVIV